MVKLYTKCANDNTEAIHPPSLETYLMCKMSSRGRYYKVVTPMVRNVIANQLTVETTGRGVP